jgi:hypothetical protein
MSQRILLTHGDVESGQESFQPRRAADEFGQLLERDVATLGFDCSSRVPPVPTKLA